MISKILIGPSSFADSDKTPRDKLVEAGYEVIDNPYRRKLTRKELLDLLDNKVVGLIAGLETIDREVLEKSKLQVVSRVGAGISNVDLAAACAMGVKVFNTPDAPTSAVAELTIGALLSLLRMIPQMDQALHDGKWQKKIGLQLQGKTVAIIGFGRIGRKVAALLFPFGVKILVVDPYINESDCVGCRKVTLEAALLEADVVTIHSSGHDRLIGDEEFTHMKKGVYLLNVARGGVVSEKALIEALENKTVAGAWLDTFEEEPYNGILCHYPNVILTPHVGSYTAECRLQMETEAVDSLLNYLKTRGDKKHED
ncbi:MAG: Phenyllactate dehydrogenase [Smithella sp. PtaU1.Bin162]|nr:MAG: Phenyllactate dehydrogenase [Smithella sp. PtaU1.Bin162]